MHIVCAKVRGQLPEIGFLTTMRVLGIEPTSPGLAAHTFLTEPSEQPSPRTRDVSNKLPRASVFHR